MSSSPSRLVRTFASTVISGGLLFATPAIVSAGPEANGFEEAMARAGAQADEGRHAEALESFEAAFEAMPEEIKIGDVGELVAHSGATSALRVFDTTNDPAVLERGKALLSAFIDAVAAAEKGRHDKASTERAQALLSVISALLDASYAELAEPPDEPPPEDPTPVEELPPPAPPPSKARPDPLGLGLVIGGSLMAEGGLATIVAGSLQVSWYEGKLEEHGWRPEATHYDYELELDEARRIRNIDLGVGAGLTAIGIGVLVYGVVRMKSAKDEGTSASGPRHRRWAVGVGRSGGTLRWSF